MSEHISKDCFWYSEDIDMGAIIPFCSKKSDYLGRRDCYRCKFYISKSSVRELVNAIQSNVGFSGENITDEINKKYEDYMAHQREVEKTMLQERLDDMRRMLQDLENQAKEDVKDDYQLSELRSTD